MSILYFIIGLLLGAALGPVARSSINAARVWLLSQIENSFKKDG